MSRFTREWGIEIVATVLAAAMVLLLARLLVDNIHDRIYARAAATTQLTPTMRVGRLVNMVEGWKRQGDQVQRVEAVLDWCVSERVYERATITVLPPVIDTTVRVVVDYSAR